MVTAVAPGVEFGGSAAAGLPGVLALHPDRVRLPRAAAGDGRSLAELWPLLSTEGVRAVSANGVLGDPTGADAAEGERLLDAATRDLIAAVAGPA